MQNQQSDISPDFSDVPAADQFGVKTKRSISCSKTQTLMSERLFYCTFSTLSSALLMNVLMYTWTNSFRNLLAISARSRAPLTCRQNKSNTGTIKFGRGKVFYLVNTEGSRARLAGSKTKQAYTLGFPIRLSRIGSDRVDEGKYSKKQMRNNCRRALASRRLFSSTG